MAVLALAIAAALGTVTVGAVPAGAAPVSANCSFANPGTGTYASTLCWFDLTGYNTGATQFIQSLPGGYTASFTMSVSGGPARATSFPTWSGSYLGNGVYTGVKGNPALYQTTPSRTTVATLTSISVTDKNGNPVTGYSLVGADAEATGPNESITWTSSGPISSLQPIGNACGNGFTGVGTTTVTCTGGSRTSGFTGDAILASTAPTQFSQTMVGGGLEGVAFGILVSAVQLNKTVVNGYTGDAFGLSVTAAGSTSILGSANTSGGSTVSTGSTTVITSAGGSMYTFAEQATSGTLSNYTRSWSCTRNGSPDPSLPSGSAGPSADVTVGIGDLVNCTITNTAIPSSVSLVKHAGTPVDVNGNGLTDAGDTIQYTFTVTNTGQLILNGVAVSDNKVGAVTCPQPTLAPGDSELCTADAPYTITAADVTAGAVDNTATASGTPAGTTATVTSSPSSTHTPATAPAPSLTVVKSADPSDAAEFTVGQTITYHFVVTNTGNVPLNNITVNEGAFNGSGSLSPAICPDSTLPVNAQETCTATYTLTQADVDQGSITNTATAEGTPPGSGTSVPSNPSTATVPTPPQPGITITKSANPETVTAAGQTVTYSFVITNTGNVTLRNIVVDDSTFSGTGTLGPIDCPSTTLVAGQAETCTADYTVTQADVDAGILTNTATVTGTPPTGGPVPPVPSNPVDVDIPRTPALSIVKTANVQAAAVGQTITYTFVVTNTGNVTIADPKITEETFSGTGNLTPFNCPAAPTSLAPGDTLTCTAEYTLTQADVDAGKLTNTATAIGTPPPGTNLPPVPPSTSTVTTDPHPALALVKTADTTKATTVGQVVTYTFTITNVGNITITQAGVKEGAFTGHGTLSKVTCPTGVTLKPGESVTCTAKYTVVAADLTGGTLSNTATATGTLPNGDPLSSDPSTAAVQEIALVAAAGLASTGSSIAGWAVGVALLLILGGAIFLIIRRRRNGHESEGA